MCIHVSAHLLILTLFASLPLGLVFSAESQADETTDPDIAIQGEYQGETSTTGKKQKTGAQVIALGKGKFRALAYLGGLPGDGWDKSDPLVCEGATSKGGASFNGGDCHARIEGDSMVIETEKGVAGNLKKVVRRSSTLNAKPPKGANILFDGKSADQFENGQATEDGLLKPGATSKLKFQSGTLHVEFQIPYGPLIPSRGNSGVYLQGRYEVQILDSFGIKPHNHECGAIPFIREPDLTMSFPPLSWQTYDIDFIAAEFQDGKKVKPARMTVRHNGVVIHNDAEVPKATLSSPLMEGPEPGPLNLQEHGGEVRFRNIWFVPN